MDAPAPIQPTRIAWLRAASWLGAEMFLPAFFVVMLWPVTKYLLELPHAYERALAGADLVPVASILLITAAVDGLFGEITRAKRSTFLMVLCILALVASLVMLSGYGFIKAEYMRYDFPKKGEAVREIIGICADISMAVFLTSGVYSTLIKAVGIYQEYENSK